MPPSCRQAWPSGVAMKVVAPFSATTAFQRRAAPRAGALGVCAIVLLRGAGQVRHLAGMRRQQQPADRSAAPSSTTPIASASSTTAARRSAPAAPARRRGSRPRPACRDRSAPRRSLRARARAAPMPRRARPPSGGLGQRDDARLGQRQRHAAARRSRAVATAACRRRRAARPSRPAAPRPASRGCRRSPARGRASSLSPSSPGCGRGQPRSSASSIVERRRRGRRRHHDFGAAGTSGSAVTGAPASRSGETKFTSRRHQLAVAAGGRVERVRRDAAVGHVADVGRSPGSVPRRGARAGSASSSRSPGARRPARARARYSRVIISSTLRSRRITSHQLSPPGGRK